MTKDFSHCCFVVVPLSRMWELRVEDPRCKPPELGIHHHVLLFLPQGIPSLSSLLCKRCLLPGCADKDADTQEGAKVTQTRAVCLSRR